ncbi:MAG: outer membrane protein transport protein [Legionella sp.]|uniref:OmpP1/FadL family transporter n=1 Tax=Legionella sp. TaxID=459 RepID=UPI0039E40A2B
MFKVISTRFFNKEIVAIAIASQSLVGMPIFAAGFQVNETSTSLQGSAMAGAAAANNDVSALFNNPATMSTLKNTQFYLGANEFLPSVDMRDGAAIHIFNAPGDPLSSIIAPVNGRTYKNNISKSAFIPYGYVGWHFGDKFSAGVAIVEPYYLSNDYSRDSVLRFVSVKSEVNSVNVNPSLAYEFNEQWSIGVGFQAQYLKTIFSNYNGIYTGISALDSFVAATKPSYLESDGWGYGYTLGGLYQPDQLTRLGISYRSQIATRLQGEGTQYTMPGPAVPAPINTMMANIETEVLTHIKTPGVFSLGVARDVNEWWTLKGGFQVNFWNRLNVLTIETPNAFEMENKIPMRWRNTWFAAIGADYRYNSSWTARTGFAFDQTPTRDTRRDPRIPDQDRFWLNFGLSYAMKNNLSIDGAYSHVFMNDKRVSVIQLNRGLFSNSTEVNVVDAKYKGSNDVVSLALRYRC